MPIGYLFWLLMILWLVLDLGWGRPWDRGYPLLGASLLLYALLFLLGWHDFGAILR